MCRRTGEYISLELFYFVSLTSSCSLILCMYSREHLLLLCFLLMGMLYVSVKDILKKKERNLTIKNQTNKPTKQNKPKKQKTNKQKTNKETKTKPTTHNKKRRLPLVNRLPLYLICMFLTTYVWF